MTINKPASRNQEKRKEIKTRKITKKLFLVQCEGSKSLPSPWSKILPDVCVSLAKGSQNEEESNRAKCLSHNTRETKNFHCRKPRHP
jgi:hypothetical protein